MFDRYSLIASYIEDDGKTGYAHLPGWYDAKYALDKAEVRRNPNLDMRIVSYSRVYAAWVKMKNELYWCATHGEVDDDYYSLIAEYTDAKHYISGMVHMPGWYTKSYAENKAERMETDGLKVQLASYSIFLPMWNITKSVLWSESLTELPLTNETAPTKVYPFEFRFSQLLDEYRKMQHQWRLVSEAEEENDPDDFVGAHLGSYSSRIGWIRDEIHCLVDVEMEAIENTFFDKSIYRSE